MHAELRLRPAEATRCLGTAAHCVDVGRPARPRHRGRRVRLGRLHRQRRRQTELGLRVHPGRPRGRRARQPGRQGLAGLPEGLDGPGRHADRRRDPALRLRPRATTRRSRRRSSARRVFALRRHRRSTRSTARSTGATRAARSSTAAPARRSASSSRLCAGACTEEGPTVQGILAKAAAARLPGHARRRSGPPVGPRIAVPP